MTQDATGRKSTFSRFLGLGVVLCSLAINLTIPAHAQPAPQEWIVPQGKTSAIKKLLGKKNFNQPLEGGYRISKVVTERNRFTFHLTQGEGPLKKVVGSITVRHISQAGPQDMRTQQFAIRLKAPPTDAVAKGHLQRAITQIRTNEGRPIFIALGPEVPAQSVKTPEPEPVQEQTSVGNDSHEDTSDRPIEVAVWQLLGGLIVGFFCLLLAAMRKRPWTFALNIKRTHILPMSLQTIIFAYWGLYWVDTLAYMPIILAQLLFAYLLDGALGIWREKQWTFSLGPFPIVFSINLFVWYQGAQTWCGFAAIAIALLGKAFIRRNGKHIFNPSVLGIAVLGALYMVELTAVGWGNTTLFTFVDVSHPLTAAPNMTELILILALIPQSRLPIVLISTFALVVMVAFSESFGGVNPLAIVRHGPLNPLWPPVFLAITLLATDPATIPKTANGRVIFGMLLGLSITLLSSWANGAGSDDYFTKVIPVIALNLLVPKFDAWGKYFPAFCDRLFAMKLNRVHMALFVILTAAGMVGTEVKERGLKSAHFNPAGQVRYLKLKERDSVCEHNRPWCTPFSFVDEVNVWLD